MNDSSSNSSKPLSYGAKLCPQCGKNEVVYALKCSHCKNRERAALWYRKPGNKERQQASQKARYAAKKKALSAPPPPPPPVVIKLGFFQSVYASVLAFFTRKKRA